MVDIVLGTLVLLSGGWMAFIYRGELPGWLTVKIALVLAAIPLGIVGMKRESKLLTALTLFLFLYVYGVAETNSLAMQKPEAIVAITTESTHSTPINTPDAEAQILSSLNESSLTNGKSIYVQVCATCHGEDGTKVLNGATNLVQSNLDLGQRQNVIHNGRGLMPGFGKQLSEQELEQVAAYTMTLKK